MNALIVIISKLIYSPKCVLLQVHMVNVDHLSFHSELKQEPLRWPSTGRGLAAR